MRVFGNHQVRSRLHLLLIATLSVLMLLMVLLLYLFFLSLTVDQLENQGLGDINHFQRDIFYHTETTSDYQRLSRLYASLKEIDIIIVDMDSYLLADSSKLFVTEGKFIDANLSAAKDQDSATSIVRDKKNNTLNVAVGKIIDTPDGKAIVSFVYHITTLSRLTTIFVLFTILMVMIITVLVYLLTTYTLHKFRRPIRKLLQHTRKAAASHGGYTKIAIDTTNTELIQLVKEFNSLIDKYDLLISSDNEKYSKINSLLSHIKTGIMIINLENDISLINPRAEELLQVNKFNIFSNEEAITPESETLNMILDMTVSVNNDHQTRIKTITTQEGTLLDVSIEAMYSKYKPYDHKGSLILLRDVTEIRRLERLKDEFVSNVSHELRTPLTVINGFVQTLQSWDQLSISDRNKSLTIIEIETERLKKLISELLMLSRIEGEMDGSQQVLFDPAVTLKEVLVPLEAVAKEKDITFSTLVMDSDFCSLSGREVWFSQIVSNLVDNAIKYSPSGSTIVISLQKIDTEELELYVEDHGMGIPEEEISRIFERFYRVEKSRNSKIAGSGLGLAITKLMVQEFLGNITVKSSYGEGTAFTITLPLASNDTFIKNIR